MRLGFLLFLLITISGYSQEQNIQIVLKSDSVINTKWIQLYDSPLFAQPFIKINHDNGYKIKLKDIKQYKGYDQNGDYRFLTANFLDNKQYIFTEQFFSQDTSINLSIFYHNNTFIKNNISTKQKRTNNGQIP